MKDEDKNSNGEFRRYRLSDYKNIEFTPDQLKHDDLSALPAAYQRQAMVERQETFAEYQEKMLADICRSLHLPENIFKWSFYDQFSCPFDFMTEFEQWFEWKWRVYSGESTVQVTGEMVRWDDETMERCKIDGSSYSGLGLRVRAHQDFGCKPYSPTGVINNSGF